MCLLKFRDELPVDVVKLLHQYAGWESGLVQFDEQSQCLVVKSPAFLEISRYWERPFAIRIHLSSGHWHYFSPCLARSVSDFHKRNAGRTVFELDCTTGVTEEFSGIRKRVVRLRAVETIPEEYLDVIKIIPHQNQWKVLLYLNKHKEFALQLYQQAPVLFLLVCRQTPFSDFQLCNRRSDITTTFSPLQKKRELLRSLGLPPTKEMVSILNKMTITDVSTHFIRVVVSLLQDKKIRTSFRHTPMIRKQGVFMIQSCMSRSHCSIPMISEIISSNKNMMPLKELFDRAFMSSYILKIPMTRLGKIKTLEKFTEMLDSEAELIDDKFPPDLEFVNLIPEAPSGVNHLATSAEIRSENDIMNFECLTKLACREDMTSIFSVYQVTSPSRFTLAVLKTEPFTILYDVRRKNNEPVSLDEAPEIRDWLVKYGVCIDTMPVRRIENN